MYYHVLIETKEKLSKSDKYKQFFELDGTDLAEIEARIVLPFLRKEDFQFNGYFLSPNEIKRLTIKETQKTTSELAKYENDNMPANILMYVSPSSIVSYERLTRDITTEVFARARAVIATATPATVEKKSPADKSKVFIVHGRDNLSKIEAARFIEKLGLTAVILHEQPNSGKTIIEKIEEHTNVGFALVLYTPCDVGGLADQTVQKLRARQNVVFEHGYLTAKLGRKNVCALVKGDIEIPNDISGVVYVPLDENSAWHFSVAKELKSSGYKIDINDIL
ncbi:TIR domain-containing protein [Pseudomonas crudilactis]|uniref:TIR domain-containing protein n=1 Tax=Pseudomonas crudilactis TaxID=2697028 RepID=UPI0015DB208E|nr:nucleotide-binding protein [Pseudomonas crudilactis]